MQRRAKIFKNTRSQEVRLPKGFQFTTSAVFIRKQGDEVIHGDLPSLKRNVLAVLQASS